MTEMNDLKIAAGYVRVSTDSQEEYSPDSQIKLIRDYAKREGYIIPDEYIFRDDGISGKSAAKRPAFQLMIATAKEQNPPFSCIFVWKFSRFARNQEESLVYKNLLKRNGVTVKSISEPSMEDSPFSGLIESIISWMDEYYLINLSGEVKRGMKEKSMRGEAMGKPPFGYDVKDKILIPNDSANTVRWIYESYANGSSYREIASAIGSDVGSTQYILRNPVYLGKIRWSDNDHADYRYQFGFDTSSLPEGKHEPIISQELWDAVQKRMCAKDNTVKYVRKDKPYIYMLKGLVRCGECGATLTRVVQHKGKSVSLQCYRYTRGRCHTSHFISMERANAAVIDALESIIGSRSYVFAPKKPVRAKPDRDWDKLISQEEARLERAKKAFLDGVFSSEEYRAVKEGISSNIAKLQTAKTQSVQAEPEPIDIQPRAVEVLSIIKSPDVDEETKNKALRSIIDKIVFNKKENTLDIYFAP